MRMARYSQREYSLDTSGKYPHCGIMMGNGKPITREATI
jgi:hypothetical protein